MGKIRVAKLGDEEQEEELKRRADARRQTKQAKKTKVEGVGLKGGERVAVVEGTEIKPEFKRLVEEVEEGVTAGREGKVPEAGKAKKKAKKAKVRVRSKRYQEAARLIDKTKTYPLSDAVSLVKKTSKIKFDGTVELHINLNPLVLGEKKELRGTVALPHGTGKQIRVAIADDTILADIEAGNITFDLLVAHPSMMPKLAKVARILGPKGLMPNPKTGTLGEDPKGLAVSLSKGQVHYKTEPDQPIIHLTVGKASFEDKKLTDNIEAVISAIGRGKIAKATLASTMGPGIKLTLS